ncbi:MAG: glutamate cyclase domain-containing protein [Hyphomonadaceae bacterium]
MSFENIGSSVNHSAFRGISGPTTDNSSSVDTNAVQKSQDKLKFALLDSGMGGGMTAAFLKGEVRQLGSYFCLPIGDKQPAVAEAYTAVMALWPLIMPLANSDGVKDGKVAENVIIACNSASVRKEGAVDLMAKFCADLCENNYEGVSSGDDFKNLPPMVGLGLKNLADAVMEETDGVSADNFRTYFTDHVHEIVSRTAEKGAMDAIGLLKDPDRTPDRDPLFVRVDSTNGTAGSQSYPTKMLEAFKNQPGVTNVELLGSTFNRNVRDTEDTITHHVVSLTVNDAERTIVIEGRGNQPWVKAVEGGTVGNEGPDLVRASNQNSETAFGKSITQLESEGPGGGRAAKILTNLLTAEGRRIDGQEGEGAAPDLSMLCCTHYPAMTSALDASYGGTSSFINQATIVRDLVSDDLNVPFDDNAGPLDLAVTVGSMNYGGADESIRPSIANGFTSANVLANVLQQTMDGDSSNVQNMLGSVNIFHQNVDDETPKDVRIKNQSTQGGSLQETFELLHQMMVTGEAEINRFYADQNLALNPKFGKDPEAPRFNFVPNDRRQTQIAPDKTKLSQKALDYETAMNLDRIGHSLDTLGTVMTLGETRGIDKIAPLNDQGAQLRAATAQLMDVVIRNRTVENPTEREPVGIMTGFSVVNNDDRTRVGGENDGPPGAVPMGKTLVDQGTPVVLVTDSSSEASLISSLLGAGLAELTDDGSMFLEQNRQNFVRNENGLGPHSLLKREHVTLNELVTVEIPDHDFPEQPHAIDLPLDDPERRETLIAERKQESREAVLATAGKLGQMNVNTMISIERPSVTQLDGGAYSMVAVDVAPFNLDLSPLLGIKDSDFNPFTIGIGDGGNELGTGGIQFMTSEGRDHEMQPFVKGGSVIGAHKDLETDVMLLSTVSNNGGMAVSMSLLAGLAQRDGGDPGQKLDDAIDSYNTTITYLHENNMSIDGVNKQNLNTVDGRRMGSTDEALQRWRQQDGQVPLGVGPDYSTELGLEGAARDTSHNDTFLRFRNLFAPVN